MRIQNHRIIHYNVGFIIDKYCYIQCKMHLLWLLLLRTESASLQRIGYHLGIYYFGNNIVHSNQMFEELLPFLKEM